MSYWDIFFLTELYYTWIKRHLYLWYWSLYKTKTPAALPQTSNVRDRKICQLVLMFSIFSWSCAIFQSAEMIDELSSILDSWKGEPLTPTAPNNTRLWKCLTWYEWQIAIIEYRVLKMLSDPELWFVKGLDDVFKISKLVCENIDTQNVWMVK